MKKIILLGATGSIGKSTFEIVRKNPDKFKIVGTSSHSKFTELETLAAEFKIPHLLNTSEEFDYTEFINQCEPDIVLNAILGFAGLKFTIETLKQKIPLALANKESLVSGGELVMQLSRENNTPIIPVDSEHSAIFQCLRSYIAPPNLGGTRRKGEGVSCAKINNFKKLYLTCSGGPFYGMNDLSQVTLDQALKHPNWNMGAKITIDSATLVNKCLEFFEAMHLFGATKDQIEIVIHRESIVHSMVEFPDSSIIAQLSPASMELPIAYALNYPKQSDYHLPSQSFKNLNLSFSEPDADTFSTLKVLDHCADQMGNFPIVFNASNEVLVEAFLNQKIRFIDIFEILGSVVGETQLDDVDSFEKIIEIDQKARRKTKELLHSQ